MNNPRRWLCVANIIEEGRWGGPQKRIAMVGAALKPLGVETVVVLPAMESARFRQELDRGGVNWTAMSLHRLGRGWKTLAIYVLTFVPEVLALQRHLRSGKFDIVHASGGAWQIKGALAGRLAGIPVIWHLNDSQMPAPVVRMFSFLAPCLATGFFVAADRCRRVYLTSKQLAAFPNYLVPAPVDTQWYAPDAHPPDAKIAALPGIKVVTVANINPIKGLETLISAAEMLNRAGYAFTVAVVGSVFATQANYFSKLKQLVAQAGLTERVVFLGGVHDVATSMAAADIYVCSSLAEASPMTLWEAMAMGKPVVSTDVGDVASYIRSGESGYIVPVGNANALADAIAALMTDVVKRRAFGERARKIVESALDLRVVGERTINGYRHVLEKSSLRS